MDVSTSPRTPTEERVPAKRSAPAGSSSRDLLLSTSICPHPTCSSSSSSDHYLQICDDRRKITKRIFLSTQDEFEKQIIYWFLYGNAAPEQQEEDSAQVSPVTPAAPATPRKRSSSM